MASHSRVAQEKLADLERNSAPFKDQLGEAARFVGLDLENVSGIVTANLDSGEGREASLYHGREEWLLRWLLKRMQDKNDDTPRTSPDCWMLFCRLLRIIPTTSTARTLHEKKFMTVLRQTLEEAQQAASERGANGNANVYLENADTSLNVSKKRKRSGELVSACNDSRDQVERLPFAIFAVIDQMLRLTKVSPDLSGDAKTDVFSKEYMKSVVSTSAEDAAKILGAWLSLCRTILWQHEADDTANIISRLSPFIEIWEYRIVANEDLMQFSLYCSKPLLSLLKVTKSEKVTSNLWQGDLERLLARNVMIPAKAANFDQTDTNLLNTLTRISVIQDSENAPILFDVAICSIQVQASRRRRPNDESWLQTVFTVLQNAMPVQRAGQNAEAVREMLQSAIKYTVVLDPSTLRSVILQYCLLERSTNWELLACVIKLDINVLMISDGEEDLVQQVLTRVTAAWVEVAWSKLSGQVVAEVLIPLMNGFAKARDLSVFISHWHAQLLQGGNYLNRGTSPASMVLSSAWEDDLLQAEFSKIMEASLTVTQVTQLLDWLAVQVTEYPNATCVILDAIARSIGREDFVDAVGLRLFHIMFDSGAFEKLDEKYRWRPWRILFRTLKWVTQAGLEQISVLWEEGAVPFDSLSRTVRDDSVLDLSSGHIVRVETLRCACAARNAFQKWTTMGHLTNKPVVNFLHSLLQDIEKLPQKLTSQEDLGQERCGATLNSVYRGVGWMLWSSVHCVFVEFPSVLKVGARLEGNAFRDMLQTIFWVSSIPQDKLPLEYNSWLCNNPEAYPEVWRSLLNNDEVLNDPVLVSLIIDVMLSNATTDVNPLVKSSTTNAFAVQCLLQLPIEVFSRNHRERVMKQWLPNPDNVNDIQSALWAPLDNAILGLKVKIMQRSTVYEGTMYQDLVCLAEALDTTKASNTDVSLSYFKELVRRTMSHITTNLDQPRNRGYVLEILDHLRKELNIKRSKKVTHTMKSALLAQFQVLFDIFTTRATQLGDLDIIAYSDLTTLKEAFQALLLSQSESILTKLKQPSKSGKQAQRLLMLRSTLYALTKLELDRERVATAIVEARSFAASLENIDGDLHGQLETFRSIHTTSTKPPDIEIQLNGDVSTVIGRQGLVARTKHLIESMDHLQKLELVHSSMKQKSGWTQLDKLWAVRLIIISCEDTRKPFGDDDEVMKDLASTYNSFCSHLFQTTSFRQFSLISETMVLMLRTKSRATNQWNVDSTLGGITSMCSRSGPHLPPNRAGNIYMHLCQLLQVLLNSHRLKLEGHFHLVVQAMQALLRCLFTPLTHSTPKTSRFSVHPPWLSSPQHQLNPKHAVAFTRLVTLICDPSVSSVTRPKNSNLYSATDKAKRMASLHMQFVLTLYIRLQLEMKMLPAVREKLVPGLYAIFDTTTPELRRTISDGLDSSGRAVFGMLFKDYQRFGKWKGS